VYSFAAIAAADRGDRGEAARLINLAIKQGYSRSLAVAEPAFKGRPARLKGGTPVAAAPTSCGHRHAKLA